MPRIDLVDLSHYQGKVKIDWTAAKKAGVKGIIHKATEGSGWTDDYYEARRAEVGKQGLKFGAYHFADPAPGNAAEQAEHFVKFADPKPGDLPPALDLETNPHGMSETELTTWVRTFCTTVMREAGIDKMLLYTHFNLSSVPTGVRLWTSRYSNSNMSPVVPQPFKFWSVWQFSDGRYGNPRFVPGIGHVDINTVRSFFGWARLGKVKSKKPAKAENMDPGSYYLGARNTAVRWLAGRLIAHGYRRFYKNGPDSFYSKGEDQAAVQAFQRAQGWRGSDADGFPGPETLKRLAAKPMPRRAPRMKPSSYRIGKRNTAVKWLAGRLVAHGYGSFYKNGIDYTYTKGEDWKAVRAFQRDQGWRGSDADGFPGPETLKRLAAPANGIGRIIRVAESQVGVHEGRRNGDWDNIQRYSREVKSLNWSQGQPWCATFVTWCAQEAGLSEFYPATASTDTGANWFKHRHQWSEYPAVGAQVFYGHGNDMCHTGLVYDYDNTYVYTIEGNTNINGSAEGDGVYRKRRVRRDAYVRGYGYPDVPGGLKSADPNYHRK